MGSITDVQQLRMLRKICQRHLEGKSYSPEFWIRSFTTAWLSDLQCWFVWSLVNSEQIEKWGRGGFQTRPELSAIMRAGLKPAPTDVFRNPFANRQLHKFLIQNSGYSISETLIGSTSPMGFFSSHAQAHKKRYKPKETKGLCKRTHWFAVQCKTFKIGPTGFEPPTKGLWLPL